jgi:lipopolysaccharide assembly outer membrane protein LptD (OstA)
MNAKTFSDVWIITSQKMKKVSKEKVISYKAKITTCDYEKPHYYFKASKVVVYLEKKFIAYNVVSLY